MHRFEFGGLLGGRKPAEQVIQDRWRIVAGLAGIRSAS